MQNMRYKKPQYLKEDSALAKTNLGKNNEKIANTNINYSVEKDSKNVKTNNDITLNVKAQNTIVHASRQNWGEEGTTKSSVVYTPVFNPVLDISNTKNKLDNTLNEESSADEDNFYSTVHLATFGNRSKVLNNNGSLSGRPIFNEKGDRSSIKESIIFKNSTGEESLHEEEILSDIYDKNTEKVYEITPKNHKKTLKGNENNRLRLFYFFILCSYYLGLVIGSFLFFSQPTSTFIAYYWQEFIAVITNGSTFEALKSLLWGAVLPLTAGLFLSFCLFSTPILLIIPFITGAGTGLLTANIYMQYGLWGAAVNLFLFLPFSCLFSAMQIFFFGKAADFSLKLLAFYRQNLQSKKALPPSALPVVKLYAFFLIITVISAFVQLIIFKTIGTKLL